MLAAAIVLAMVLYLVDKNHKWALFGKLMAGVGIALVFGMLGVYDYDKHETKAAGHDRICAAKVRATYPGTYDDLSDVALTEKTLAKYPHFCD